MFRDVKFLRNLIIRWTFHLMNKQLSFFAELNREMKQKNAKIETFDVENISCHMLHYIFFFSVTDTTCQREMRYSLKLSYLGISKS